MRACVCAHAAARPGAGRCRCQAGVAAGAGAGRHFGREGRGLTQHLVARAVAEVGMLCHADRTACQPVIKPRKKADDAPCFKRAVAAAVTWR